MLSFIKKLFGSNPAEVAAPYKVETPVAKEPAKKPAAKKAVAKAKPARKPRTPKA
jgi:hypothetical protein